MSKSATSTLSNKLLVMRKLNILPHLNCVATLPREMFMQNRHASEMRNGMSFKTQLFETIVETLLSGDIDIIC